MDEQNAQSLTARAAELAQAAQNIGFMPSGVRATLEGVAAFAQDCARAIEANDAASLNHASNLLDTRERLEAEAATNAEILAKLGELTERIEALETRGA